MPRAVAAFADELRRVALALPGAALAPDWSDPARGVDGFTIKIGDCVLGLSIHNAMKPGSLFGGDVAVYAPRASTQTDEACTDALRRIAATVDAELASGRHDHLILLY